MSASSIAIQDINTSSENIKLNLNNSTAKELNFLLTSNRVDKAKLKTELETLGRLSR